MSLMDIWLPWLPVWGHTVKSFLSPPFPSTQWERLGRMVWVGRDK